MGMKEQFSKIKENWLLLVLVLVVILFLSNGSRVLEQGVGAIYDTKSMYAPMADMEQSLSYGYDGGGRGYYPNDDFAPEVETRVITKTASLTSEVKRGTFQAEAFKVKSLIRSTDSFLLNENVNNYGSKLRSYYVGSYQIKVDVNKYDDMITQLKEIGEVTSFNENQLDITAEYTNIQIEIETEKDRLERYKDMYDEAKEVEDKIELSDRIFNQERMIKYMEDSLENMDKRVDYSTIYLTVTEKQSEYADVLFVKFSELVRNLVSSFNSLVNLIFVVVPWAIAALVIYVITRIIKKKK